MKNYYEILAYADREDLTIEETDRDTYVGFKSEEESKTLFRLSSDRDLIKDFLEELWCTKYKESNLYKVAAKALIKDLIEDLYEEHEVETNPEIIDEFKHITGYEFDDKDLENLKKVGICCDCKGNLCNEKFLNKKELIESILSSKKIFITEENVKDILSILPDYSYILSEIDDALLLDSAYYDFHYHAESTLIKSEYYDCLRSDINKILNLIKSNQINVKYESHSLKDEVIMRIFLILFDAANILDEYNYMSGFEKEYLNYYNTFYDGKVSISEK